MFRLRSRIYIAYLFIDIAFITLCFYIPFRFSPGLLPHSLPSGIKIYLATYIFWGVSLLFFLHQALLYYTDRCMSIVTEGREVSKCVLGSSLLAALFLFVLKIDIFSRSIFIESTILLLLSLSLWRTLKRMYVRYFIQKGYANCNVLIVGAGEMGLTLADEIKTSPYLGIKPIGFIDDAKSGEIDGIPVLGKIDDIGGMINRYFIDEIYVTIPSERKVVNMIIQKGMKLGRTVRIVAEHFNMPYSQVKLNHIGVIPLVTYFEKTNDASNSVTKRMLDIVVSGLALVLLSPLFAIIAYAIKLESLGPIFYISKRSGRKGVTFGLLKFRSMVKDADSHKDALRCKSEVEGPIFKIRNDPRMTTVGRFLRRFSIDELPQLINVFKGEMSLVGPRPFPVEENEKFECRHIRRLNSMRPGMTGLAQVKGRSDLKFNDWMRWDLWYIDNWSLWFDIKILLWTIPAVFRGKGAY